MCRSEPALFGIALAPFAVSTSTDLHVRLVRVTEI